jgi:Ni/Co efflux regulator RcnB
MKNGMRFIGVLAAGLFLAGGALAEKPSWAGGGKPDKKAKAERAEQGRPASSGYFDDDLRRLIGDYYGTQRRAGKCPPGLAKKNNGCLPPGQAKKWAKGKPLPPGLAYGELPYDLLRRLPPPPANHRYVQIAGDILLIAVGSSMVIDAVEDLFR